VREPAPLVTRCRSRTVANGDSITFEVRRCFHVFGGEVEEREQHVSVLLQGRDGLRLKIGRTKGYSLFVPTSHLPGASTSPPPFRNEAGVCQFFTEESEAAGADPVVTSQRAGPRLAPLDLEVLPRWRGR